MERKIIVLAEKPVKDQKSLEIRVAFTAVTGNLRLLTNDDWILSRLLPGGKFEHYGTYNSKKHLLVESDGREVYAVAPVPETLKEIADRDVNAAMGKGRMVATRHQLEDVSGYHMGSQPVLEH